MHKFISLAAMAAMLGMLVACGSTASTPAATSAPKPAAVTASETRDSSQSISDIKDVQDRLAHLGLYHGKVDGIWGPATQGAVANFQQSNNLPVTGKLNDATVAALHKTDTAPVSDTNKG